MKVTNLPSIILFASIVFFSCGSSKVATSSDPYEQALAEQGMGATLWFQTSAEMRAAYYQAYQYGRMILEKKLALQNYDNPAIVFDIDETLLDNSPYQAWLIHNGRTYSSSTWKDWTDQARAEALPGALEFVAFVRSKGIDVFYISNRKTTEQKSTMENLKELGFPQVTDEHVLLRSASSDKTERRKRVQDSHEILLYVGDNLTDFNQVFDARGADYGKGLVDQYRQELLNSFVMLPNPMYGEWERAVLRNETGLSSQEQAARRKAALKE
ncbi:5'-nucleotidase, lipoprotein e(P4) family [Fulvivirga sedimenti]|uniref:5'-nucleotidase, lipoprotein e(P4) family n=1 Tax=Fulvivirga sedimenti TaxID=2879465 RepID=A0A9X1HQW2_9BACT|nr:5'-nucleotidase, lipoprotein e(P4) family [Fulvivirga sedimenti]MCA6075501.1 5'-nucleotidase, lipoprotein e(P4) family [Fulvivirga sedimenti]MCA6076678.1 5'-nucleotidase, lipoprotein e(P4) family [Fulvivirga sedimenti]MCA6077806.1 5'-nucleotidase, lipoprotein e(P4) family [Fulvivirga sedimenti]